MSEELSRETRKLEVRLKVFLKEEEIFVKELKTGLDKFKELNKTLERLKMKAEPKMVKERVNLRLEAIKSLSKTQIKASDVEHENSHSLESYGNLFLTLEGEFKDHLNR